MFTRRKFTKKIWKLKMGAIREDTPIFYIPKWNKAFSCLC